MKTKISCESCLKNFTIESLWEFYDLNGYPICENCYDELISFI